MTTFLLLTQVLFLASTLYFTSSSFLSVTKLLLEYNFRVLFTPLNVTNSFFIVIFKMYSTRAPQICWLIINLGQVRSTFLDLRKL